MKKYEINPEISLKLCIYAGQKILIGLLLDQPTNSEIFSKITVIWQ